MGPQPHSSGTSGRRRRNRSQRPSRACGGRGRPAIGQEDHSRTPRALAVKGGTTPPDNKRVRGDWSPSAPTSGGSAVARVSRRHLPRGTARCLVAFSVVVAPSLLLAAPAEAAGPVAPFARCVWENHDGTVTAVYGYTNSSGSIVSIGAGTKNYFRPSPPGPFAGQPQVFAPGTRSDAFVVTYTGRRNTSRSRWVVDDHVAIAGKVACPTNPVPQFRSWWLVVGLAACAVGVALLVGQRRGYSYSMLPVRHGDDEVTQ